MTASIPNGLSGHQIAGPPRSIYYIPNFITVDEEAALLKNIPSNRWISLIKRRLQALPARLTATNTLVASTQLPKWLTVPAVQRIHELGVFADGPHGINHCLINEYLPGQGIMPHEDGPAYHPVTATVSLGGSIVLDVTEKKGTDAEQQSDNAAHSKQDLKHWRIFQEPRSLLVTMGPAYTDTLHGISEVEEDVELGPDTVANWTLLGDANALTVNGGRSKRTTRISLTFRDVQKVSAIGSKIFGRPKG